MHYFLSRRAYRLGIGTLNLPPVSSNAIRFGTVPIDGNQIMSCFVITRLQVNPPALNNRLLNLSISVPVHNDGPIILIHYGAVIDAVPRLLRAPICWAGRCSFTGTMSAFPVFLLNFSVLSSDI